MRRLLLSKRIVSTVLLVVLVLQTTGAGSQATPAELALQASLSLSLASVVAPAPMPFTEDVLVDCGANADGVGAVVTFDPAVLQVVSVVPDSSAFPLLLRNVRDNQSGTVLYDAGAPLECHAQGNCPSGVKRVATITFYPVALSLRVTHISLYGQVTWNGEYVFDGEGNGSIVTILPPPVALYLPLIMRSYR